MSVAAQIEQLKIKATSGHDRGAVAAGLSSWIGGATIGDLQATAGQLQGPSELSLHESGE
jgi:hypothetical protein